MNRSRMSKVLTITNNKGGVGKTTTTFLAGAFAEAGHRILAIDLDPSRNLTAALLGKDHPTPTIYDILVDQAPLRDAVRLTKFPNIDVVPADKRLEHFIAQFHAALDGHVRLDTAIHERQTEPDPYDLILIDTPPTISVITRNALAAADWIIIPIEPARFSVQGLDELLGCPIHRG